MNEAATACDAGTRRARSTVSGEQVETATASASRRARPVATGRRGELKRDAGLAGSRAGRTLAVDLPLDAVVVKESVIIIAKAKLDVIL